jgi:repressor LexA
MTVETAASASLPMLGSIAAGQPIQAINDNPAPVAVPAQMIRGSAAHYALEVKGDSMIDAGINDGDVVVIRETSHADDGDIVVAQIDGYEATLKRYRKRGDTIVLEAANPAYEPRVLPVGAVSVQGRLVGLIRTY